MEEKSKQNDFVIVSLDQNLQNISKQFYQFNVDTPVELTLTMLLDLYLLSECKFFIGAQRSMFSWIGFEFFIFFQILIPNFLSF